jgi:hypothetical protein
MNGETTSNFLRPLGAMEEIFWLFDQNTPVHFALAAEVQGRITVEEWRAALDALQRRHPLLSVCIDSSHNRVPHFRRVENAPIPLRIVEDIPADWETEIEKELSTPFDHEQAPLVRAVVLHQETKAVFILVMHHSIADGLSSAFAIGDVLRALSGETLAPLPLMPSREEVYGLPQRVSAEAGLDVRAGAATEAFPILHIQRLSLGPDLTRKLQKRAKEEGTTVHGALCGALVLAGRRVDSGWRDDALRVRSPANLRSLLGMGDNCMLAVSSFVTVFEPQEKADLWELARFLKSDSLGAATREGAGISINAAHQAVLSGMNVQMARELLENDFREHALVTNLGRLPFDTSFGRLKLEALWGPTVLVGIGGRQTLGAVTVNGSLNLIHTSRAPLPALLKNIEDILAKACSLTSSQ